MGFNRIEEIRKLGQDGRKTRSGALFAEKRWLFNVPSRSSDDIAPLPAISPVCDRDSSYRRHHAGSAPIGPKITAAALCPLFQNVVLEPAPVAGRTAK